MIVVVEGISASGKSTWCASHGGGQVISEARREASPRPFASHEAAASFWVDHNVARWMSALAVEAESGLAICDTDPLKLHYAWCLWQIGEGSEERWRNERAATRQAMLTRRIGFADAYLVGAIDPEIARRQREGDRTRRRGNFELHLRLQPSLLVWYGVLSSVLPSLFTFSFPDQVPTTSGKAAVARYDVELFDRAMALLPNPEGASSR